MAKQSRQTAAVSSPAATGGAGNVFELHVGAHWLALLLVRGIPPVFDDGTVAEVHFQTERLGWRTDDFLIECELASGGRCKLVGQVKRALHVSAGNADFKQVIEDAWRDFKNSEMFSPTGDRIVIVVLRGTNSMLEHLTGLLDCSRAAGSGEDFLKRLGTQGFVNSTIIRYCEAVQSILAALEGRTPDVGALWSFLRVLHVLSMDLSAPTRQTEAYLKTLLACSTQEPEPRRLADETWNALLREASDGIPRARSYIRNTLPEFLRARHAPVTRDDTQARNIHRPTSTTSLGSVPLRNSKLIGRSGLLGEVANLLTSFASRPSKDDHNVVAFHGMPGLGTSALAVAIAYHPIVSPTFSDGIFWHSIGKRSDAFGVVSRLCGQLRAHHLLNGIDGAHDQTLRIAAAKEVGGRLRAFLLRSDQRALFIFDDVWYPAQIEPILITGGRCASLFTTRQLSIAEDFAPLGQRKELPRLSNSEALTLLSEMVGSDILAEYAADCHELVIRLAGLPLALKVAGGLLLRAKNRGHLVGDLIVQLKERTDLLLSEPVPAGVRQFLEDVDNPNVIAVFQLSTDELDAQTRECFAVLGDIAPTNEGTFGLRWMAAGWSLAGDQARAVADRLVEAGLIQPAREVGGEMFYYMHDLLIQHAKTMIEGEGE